MSWKLLILSSLVILLGFGCQSGDEKVITEQEKKIEELSKKVEELSTKIVTSTQEVIIQANTSTVEKIDDTDEQKLPDNVEEIKSNTKSIVTNSLPAVQKIVPKIESNDVIKIDNKNSYYDKLNEDIKSTCNLSLKKQAGIVWSEDEIKSLYILLQNCNIGREVEKTMEETGKTPFQILGENIEECKKLHGSMSTLSLDTGDCVCLSGYHMDKLDARCVEN